MPTYEYECSLCQHHYEMKQRFEEEAVSQCPQCQGKARRVLHSLPIIFKGSGFYVTDNRKGADTEGRAEKSLEPAAKGEKKADTEGKAEKSLEPAAKGEKK